MGFDASRALWVARFHYVDPATGETKRSRSYGKTAGEARNKMNVARERIAAGSPARDAKVSLADYALTWINTTLAASPIKQTTKATYATLARTHIIGRQLGSIGLDRLRARDVEGLILEMGHAGRAESTIRQTYTVLRKVLDTAVRDELVSRNVAALVKRPGVARKEARYLTPEEVLRLLRAAEETRYHVLLSILARTGLRRGEALALRWSDVDLAGSDPQIRVQGTLSRLPSGLTITDTKTERSRRRLPLDPVAVELLVRHRDRQADERRHARSLWVESGLIFATETGGPVDPRNALRALSVAAKAAGLKNVGLHSLRHSAATTMLSAGVPLTTVSAVLGHSSVAITGDVYGHTSPGDLRGALARLGETL